MVDVLILMRFIQEEFSRNPIEKLVRFRIKVEVACMKRLLWVNRIM